MTLGIGILSHEVSVLGLGQQWAAGAEGSLVDKRDRVVTFMSLMTSTVTQRGQEQKVRVR